MKVAFTTLGCKVNQYETQALKEAFADNGYDIVSEALPSDVCVVNTCSVTNLSDRKSRQAIRRFKKLNPESVVVVTGCYAQTGGDTLQTMEEVDIIVGTNEKHRLLELVEKCVLKRKEENSQLDTMMEASPKDHIPFISVLKREEIQEFEELGVIEAMDGRTRAFIKIQEGCDRFCSYCIIPYARGRVRSRGMEEILKEAHNLIQKQYHEIVLTGINTALYGTERLNPFKDETSKSDLKVKELSMLHELVEKIEGIPGDFRIRLSSVEPTVINAEYMKRLLNSKRLCPHIHLSVQSGSDRILKAMNRSYDREAYLKIIEVVKAQDPLFGITTDIIVGFPSETEEDFDESLKLVQQVDFCKVHVFRYSKRGGTKASEMDHQIPSIIKNERSAKLIAAAEISMKRFIKKNEGAVREVLFEEITEDGKYLTGLTDNYIKAYIEITDENTRNLLNSLKKIKLGAPFLDGIAGNLV